GIAVFDNPAVLKTAAISDIPGSDECTRHQCLVLRDMRDDLLERKQHALAYTFRTDLAVDADFHPQVVWVADLVGRHDPGAHDVAAVKALALGGAQPPLHLKALGVTGGEIVEDGEAEDVVFGL